MTLPTVTPSLPAAESDLIRSGSSADPSGSDVPGRNTAAQARGCVAGPSEAEWSEERDRELAARAFVNAAADIALSMSLGALCVRAKCAACGINFLAMTKRDDLCHVCMSEGRP